MAECGETISYEYEGLEPCTYRCMLRVGHKGSHYHQTIGGGVAWWTPEWFRG